MSSLLDKAFRLLELLKPSDGITEWASADLAKKTGYTRGTTHRILQQLKKHGFVYQNVKTKKFRLGSAFISYGFLARSLFELRDFARPVMERLSQVTQESIYLNVPIEGKYALLIDTIDSRFQLRIVEPLGLQLPLHIGATRKVILAYMSPEEQDHYFQSMKLELRTSNEVITEDEMRAELAMIRSQGYAVSYGETTPGTAGVAVPIIGVESVKGSLGIATPDIRLRSDTIPQFVKLLTEGAVGIQQSLGNYK